MIFSVHSFGALEMHIYYKLVLIVLTVVNYVVYSGVCFGLIFAQGVFI